MNFRLDTLSQYRAELATSELGSYTLLVVEDSKGELDSITHSSQESCAYLIPRSVAFARDDNSRSFTECLEIAQQTSAIAPFQLNQNRWALVLQLNRRSVVIGGVHAS